MLFHIAYASTAATALDHGALLGILERARVKNAQLGVTGVLLHQAGHFFQVIEGPYDAVQALYHCIERDPRHGQIVRIIEEPIFQRDFPGWSMGLAEVDGAMLGRVDGLNDYFQDGVSFSGLTPGRACKLMSAFKQGRWRQRVEGASA